MKRQILTTRLLALTALMYFLGACVNPYDTQPSRLSCDELQALQETFQPYLAGKQLPEQNLAALWEKEGIGIIVVKDEEDRLVRIGIGFGFEAFTEASRFPLFRIGELTQCLKAEPSWYYATQYLHFEAGPIYQYYLFYPEIGVTVMGEDGNRQGIPPPFTSDRIIDSLVLSPPGDLVEIDCTVWHLGIASDGSDFRPVAWTGWESIEYAEGKMVQQLSNCR